MTGPTPKPNVDEPLGLARGSVRAILVLSLVLAIEIIAIAVTIRAVMGADGNFAREAFTVVFGAIVGLANLAVGYYFGTRSTSAKEGGE